MIVNAAFLLFLMLDTGRPYVVPYQDEFFGNYPPIIGLRNFLSAWTPNSFGSTASSAVPWGYALNFVAQLVIQDPLRTEIFVMSIPLLISGVFTYRLAKDVMEVGNWILAAALSLAYEFNWFTLELVWSNLVMFAFASFPIILLFASNLFRGRGKSWRNSIGVAFGLLLGSILWGIVVIPVLLIFVAVPAIEALFRKDRKGKWIRWFKNFGWVLISLLLFGGFTLPYSISILDSLFAASGNISSFSSSIGLVSVIPSSASFTDLAPRAMSLLVLPLSPTLRDPLWVLGSSFVVLLAVGLVLRDRHAPLVLALFLPIIVLIWLFWGVANNETIVAMLYSDIFFLRILSITVYLLLLTGLVILGGIAGASCVEKALASKDKRRRAIVLGIVVLLILVPITSHNIGIIKLGALGSGGTLDADNFNHPVLLLSPALESLITMFNLEKQQSGPFRILWIPFDSNYLQLLQASSDDIISSNILQNQALLTEYTSMLKSVEANNFSNVAPKMSYLGFEYVVVLKNAESLPPQVVMSAAGFPLGVTGNSTRFQRAISKSSQFVSVIDQSEFSVYRNLDASNKTFNGVFGVLPQTGYPSPAGALAVISGPPPYLTDEYTIRVNLSAPSIFLFDEIYDSAWQATLAFGNGTIIRPQHLEILGWANGWALPAGEGMTLQIRFPQQQKFDLVAFALVILVTSGILYLTGGSTRRWFSKPTRGWFGLIRLKAEGFCH
ncbi:MAG: hypothetical protein JRN59_06930 [Nitrososphaerota archaeon]|nr:hypothetical protein [Nitrososphaerota archaeon]